MDSIEDIVGVVLAGGQSRRMGGGDKGLRPLGGKPILAYVMERFAPQVSRVVLNANGDPARFAAFGCPVIADTISGFQGPLAGIEAALTWIAANSPRTRWAVTVPGDTPFVPTDLVTRLVEAVGEARMAVACSEAGVHPVVGLWPVTIVEALRDALAKEQRKVTQWVEQQGAAKVFFPPVEIGKGRIDPFFNINRPEDLGAAEALIGARA